MATGASILGRQGPGFRLPSQFSAGRRTPSNRDGHDAQSVRGIRLLKAGPVCCSEVPVGSVESGAASNAESATVSGVAEALGALSTGTAVGLRLSGKGNGSPAVVLENDHAPGVMMEGPSCDLEFDVTLQKELQENGEQLSTTPGACPAC